MNIHPKIRWGCSAPVVMVTLFAGFVFFTNDAPDYDGLKSSCDDALSKSPSSGTLNAWMKSNQISGHYKKEPFDESFKHILVSNGISAGSLDRASSCTYFEGLHLRGGFFSTHVAYGYFVFAVDGSLIDYSIDHIYYGM
jgi:hypothetical protein